MKILHTSDWHLNERLKHVPRQGDIVARLEEIAGYLEEYQVDVMVVAGDLFSHYNRLEELKSAMGEVNRIFKPFLLQGGTIVTISGNHDDENFFNLLRSTLDLADPIAPQKSGLRPRGKLYLAAQPTYLSLEDKAGQIVQFVLMPYPTSARYLKDENTRYKSHDDKNRRLHQAMLQEIDRLKEKTIDPRLPSVLVGHAYIRGSELHNLYKISEREDVIFEPGDIPSNWSYAAFGHIHKPQALAGTTHIRYSGSIERLDYGEHKDNKSVVLVEIASGGRTQDPICLPLNATPIYRIEISDPQTQLPRLKEQYPDFQRALAAFKLIYKPGTYNRDAVRRELETIFPRWYKYEEITVGSDISLTHQDLMNETKTISEVLHDYLQKQLKDHTDRKALLELAEQLLMSENP